LIDTDGKTFLPFLNGSSPASQRAVSSPTSALRELEALARSGGKGSYRTGLPLQRL
jgi:hypothetical protein